MRLALPLEAAAFPKPPASAYRLLHKHKAGLYTLGQQQYGQTVMPVLHATSLVFCIIYSAWGQEIMLPCEAAMVSLQSICKENEGPMGL